MMKKFSIINFSGHCGGNGEAIARYMSECLKEKTKRLK